MQDGKAATPIDVTAIGMNTDVRDWHPSKAFGPIDVTESGIAIVDNRVHLRKALCPMATTESGKLIVCRVVHCTKARGAINISAFERATLPFESGLCIHVGVLGPAHNTAITVTL